MDYRHLRYFMEVASQKSFSKAARNLHISQSAISRMIKSLEDEMGVILFVRNAKTVELTAAGTVPDFHRVPFSFGRRKPPETISRLQNYLYYISIPNNS